MNASDIAKTAIVTPFGLFEYKRMPFGLKNAAQTFQRLMDNVLRDCSFAYVYLDDILVASSSVDEHRQHLRQLFRKLADYGLVWSFILRNVYSGSPVWSFWGITSHLLEFSHYRAA